MPDTAIPAVDAPAAREMLEQIHEHVSTDELRAIVDDLQSKAAAMQELLLAPGLSRPRIAAALDLTFVGARRSGAILASRDGPELVAWMSNLLDEGGAPPGARVDRFCAAAGRLDDERATELASELLHFTAPDTRWPAARWLWSERSRTGALVLLLSGWPAADCGTPGERYVRIGPAVRAVHESPEAGGFRLLGGGRLATDALLACSYAVYMRIALGLGLTREFNAVIPPPAQLARRLLGIQVPLAQRAAQRCR